MSACYPPFPVILLVGPDHEARTHASGLIRRRLPACEVLEAGDGPQAVAAVRHARPGLVVMDSQLPGGQVHEAAARILDEAPDTRMVMLTAHAHGAASAAADGQGLTWVHAPLRPETVDRILQIGGWLQ